MYAPLFGFLTDAQDSFNELLHNVLLVAGGFLVGYISGGLLAWALGKYALKMKDTTNAKAVGRPVCGAIVALIIAMIVFTGKGKPIGDGGDDKGTTSNEGSKSNPANATPDPKVNPKITTPVVDTKPADVTLRVTVLGGEDVLNEKFYLLDDDRRINAKTFTELKAAIAERRKNEKGKVVVAVLFPVKNALPREHPAVTQVAKWAAEEAGLDVVFPAVR